MPPEGLDMPPHALQHHHYHHKHHNLPTNMNLGLGAKYMHQSPAERFQAPASWQTSDFPPSAAAAAPSSRGQRHAGVAHGRKVRRSVTEEPTDEAAGDTSVGTASSASTGGGRGGPRTVKAGPGKAGAKSVDSSRKQAQDRRREERNRREQRRSNQISQQIEELKDILASSGWRDIHPQSNKYTILRSAADYIRDLQIQNQPGYPPGGAADGGMGPRPAAVQDGPTSVQVRLREVPNFGTGMHASGFGGDRGGEAP